MGYVGPVRRGAGGCAWVGEVVGAGGGAGGEGPVQEQFQEHIGADGVDGAWVAVGADALGDGVNPVHRGVGVEGGQVAAGEVDGAVVGVPHLHTAREDAPIVVELGWRSRGQAAVLL